MVFIILILAGDQVNFDEAAIEADQDNDRSIVAQQAALLEQDNSAVADEQGKLTSYLYILERYERENDNQNSVNTERDGELETEISQLNDQINSMG